MASVIPVAVVLVTAVVLVSPTASSHTHAHDATGAAVSTDGHVHDASATTTGADDLGLAALSNGHQHAHAADVILDPATKAALAAQLDKTRLLMDRYPTVADGHGGRLPPGRPVHARASAPTTCPRRSR